MLAAAPLLLALSLTAGQATTTVDAAVRSDVRAGLSPGVVATGVTPTADLTLTPSVSGSVERHGDVAQVSYSPTLQLRSQWPQSGGVLGQHTGAARGALGTIERLGQLTAGATFTVGRVDLGTASRLLGQAAGAGVGGALSVADANASVGYRVSPIARLETAAQASVNVLGVPTAASTGTTAGFDALAWLLLPNLGELTPFVLGQVDATADYGMSRQLRLGGGVQSQVVGQLQPVGFASTAAFGRARWRIDRTFALRGQLGVLGALEQDGPSLAQSRVAAAPLADGQLDVDLVLGRQAAVSGSVGVGVVPAFDLFLGQLTHRANTRGTLTLTWDRLSLTSTVSSWSLLPLLTAGAPRAATLLQPDAHVLSGDVITRFVPLDGLELGAGMTGFVRAQASPDGLLAPPSAVLPELMAFAFVRASTSFRH